MKINREQLKEIILEEIENALSEKHDPSKEKIEVTVRHARELMKLMKNNQRNLAAIKKFFHEFKTSAQMWRDLHAYKYKAYKKLYPELQKRQKRLAASYESHIAAIMKLPNGHKLYQQVIQEATRK